MLMVFVDADNVGVPKRASNGLSLFDSILSRAPGRFKLVVRCQDNKRVGKWSSALQDLYPHDSIDVKAVAPSPQSTDASILVELMFSCQEATSAALLTNDILLRKTFAALCDRLGIELVAAGGEHTMHKGARRPVTSPASQCLTAAQKRIRDWLAKHKKFNPLQSIPQDALCSISKKPHRH